MLIAARRSQNFACCLRCNRDSPLKVGLRIHQILFGQFQHDFTGNPKRRQGRRHPGYVALGRFHEAFEQLGLGEVLPPPQLGVGNGNGAPTEDLLDDPPQASDGKVSLRIGSGRIDEALEA
jgi:hypothetical protein